MISRDWLVESNNIPKIQLIQLKDIIKLFILSYLLFVLMHSHIKNYTNLSLIPIRD